MERNPVSRVSPVLNPGYGRAWLGRRPLAINHVSRSGLTKTERRRSIARHLRMGCAMRCLLCGEEMHVVETTPDEALLVPGFEHHRLRCSSCHDEEHRLVFIRQTAPLSPPIERDGSGPDFTDATLQPLGEGPV